jgi:hypothetical protein
MRLRITKRGAEAIDEQGNPATIATIDLVYDGESWDALRVHATAEADASQEPVWTIAIPLQWVEDAFARAFYFEGGPISLADIWDDDSEIGAIARDEATSSSQASHNAFHLSVARRASLSKEAAERFAKELGEELPRVVQRLLENAVEVTRDTEERTAGLRLPWRGAVPRRRKRGGQPGDFLAYYLSVFARTRRTGESLDAVFTESLSPLRAKARFYEGRRVFIDLKRRR